MNKALSWTLLALLTQTLILSWWFGIAQVVWAADTYYISTGIMGIGFVGYLWGFRNVGVLYRFAEITVGLGFMGTVLGLSIGTAAIAISQNPLDAIPAVAIALHTTFVGVMWAIPLRISAWLLGEEK